MTPWIWQACLFLFVCFTSNEGGSGWREGSLEYLCPSRKPTDQCEKPWPTALTSDAGDHVRQQTSDPGLGCSMWNWHGRALRYSLTWKWDKGIKVISSVGLHWDAYLHSYICFYLSERRRSARAWGERVLSHLSQIAQDPVIEASTNTFIWLSSLQSVPRHIAAFPEHRTALGPQNTDPKSFRCCICCTTNGSRLGFSYLNLDRKDGLIPNWNSLRSRKKNKSSYMKKHRYKGLYKVYSPWGWQREGTIESHMKPVVEWPAGFWLGHDK